MNAPSMDNVDAAMPIKFSNYDVLLVPTELQEPIRFAPGHHVGNQRFQVLLSLYRQRYYEADKLGDKIGCLQVAQEVIETVCNKCEPKGRFFEQGHDGKWRQFQSNSPSAAIMILKALTSTPQHRSADDRVPKRVCSSSDIRSPKRARVSLLEKKPSAEAFDVICEANGLSISQDRRYTGNNRLKIMINIRIKNYKSTADKEGKQRIASDIVSSIVDDAKANFIQADPVSDKYIILTNDMAVTCVKKALDGASGTEKKIHESEVTKLARRRHKKKILGRLEHRNGDKCGKALSAPPSTTFNTFNKRVKFATVAV